MAKSGHHFPSGHGFTSSSGRVQNVRAHTRAAPKKLAAGGMAFAGPRSAPKPSPTQYYVAPKGPPPGVISGPKPSPYPSPSRPLPVKTIPTAPLRGRAYAGGGFVMSKSTIGDQGNSAVKRGSPPITEADANHGGRGSLLPGYKKGGAIPKGAKPKGKGFSKSPMFGKYK